MAHIQSILKLPFLFCNRATLPGSVANPRSSSARQNPPAWTTEFFRLPKSSGYQSRPPTASPEDSRTMFAPNKVSNTSVLA